MDPLKPSADPTADEARVKAWFEQDPLTGGSLGTFLTNTRTQAFIVIQDDTVRYEHYSNGMQRDSLITSFSAKSSLFQFFGMLNRVTE